MDYPRSYAALRAWFPSDAACLDYLDWLRLLEQAVQAEPRTYRSLVTESGSGRRDRSPPPPDKRVRPASLAGESLDRPWRRQA